MWSLSIPFDAAIAAILDLWQYTHANATFVGVCMYLARLDNCQENMPSTAVVLGQFPNTFCVGMSNYNNLVLKLYKETEVRMVCSVGDRRPL